MTGENAEGKAVIVSDDMIEPLETRPGAELHRLWSSDSIPTLPVDGSRPEAPLMFPPPGGYRFNFTTIPPDSVPRDQPGAAAADLGISNLYEEGKPGVHTTDTIDFDYIVSGELWLEMDDGQEVKLSAGDCVVQNGTRHAWRNRSEEPVVMLAVCVGAPRRQT